MNRALVGLAALLFAGSLALLAAAPLLSPEGCPASVASAGIWHGSPAAWAGYAEVALRRPLPTIGGRDLAELITELDKTVPAALEREGVPGAAVALVGDGQVLWVRGYGLADKGTGAAVTADTVFRGASFSKTMVAHLALKLVEERSLDLDRPLVDYAGEAYIGSSRLRDVTLRMVLSHTSGFTDITNDGTNGGRGSIVYQPGAFWSYSSDGFRYLAWVIEEVTGEPFDQYAEERLLEPLGMADTDFLWREEYGATAAKGYDYGVPVAVHRSRQVNAAYGVYTSARDYARFVATVLSPGAGDPVRLEQASTAAMFTAQVDTADGVWWGLGWGLEGESDGSPGSGDLYAWQWGWVEGFRHLAVLDPEDRDGVVVLTNAARGLHVAEDVVRVIFPCEHPVFASMIDNWE